TPIAALLASAAGMALAAVLSKLIPGDAFVFLFGVSIFGGLFVWAMIFATHVRYQAGGRRQAAVGFGRQAAGGSGDQAAGGSTGTPGEFAAWRIALSTLGLLLMIGIIITTWWTPGLRV